MEFRFNLNDIFTSNISVINYTLLPSNFSGDRRNAQICVNEIAEIIDEMGIASAKAQDLQHPITSASKMKNSDQTMYLMIEPGDNDGNGSVVGLLKVGVKNLFLFDEVGMVHENKSLCILDFYVHETKQRSGFGKKLYDYMLHDKNIQPCKLAIDKPSQKFLSFLYKHYGLAKIYPQNNNFVLFEGFFWETDTTDSFKTEVLDNCDNSAATIEKDDRNCFDNHSVNSEDYKPVSYGRHVAFKPHDSMAKCLGWLSPPQAASSQLLSGRHFETTHHTDLW